MAKQTICNMCGSVIDGTCEDVDFSLHTRLGYGSGFDGRDVDFDLCCECGDQMIEELIKRCKVSPLSL